MSGPAYRGVLLFGAPGVGKGTQGAILGAIPGFFHISSGDVFRSLDSNSALGIEVASFINRGELVPDELTLRVWQRALDEAIANRKFSPQKDMLVLDGIPRNVHQAKLLADIVEIVRVIHLACSDEEAMIVRMKRRALLENRADDANEEVIRYRFQVYHRVSQPVLDSYPQDLMCTVDAMGAPAYVLRSILDCVLRVSAKSA